MDEETMYQELVSMGYTEEEIKLIMELGLFPAEEEMIGREDQMAKDLRQTKGPKGYHVGQGRAYVAASGLEHAGAAAQRVLGEWQQRRLDEQRRKIAEEQVKGRRAYLRGGRGLVPPAPNPPMQRPPWATPPIMPETFPAPRRPLVPTITDY